MNIKVPPKAGSQYLFLCSIILPSFNRKVKKKPTTDNQGIAYIQIREMPERSLKLIRFRHMIVV
jgi:hypothetical protein